MSDLKIFIGGLSYTTTSEGLAAYFGKFGSVKSAKVMTTMDHKSRGFGFCTFESKRVYQNVLRKKNHVIDNRRVHNDWNVITRWMSDVHYLERKHHLRKQ